MATPTRLAPEQRRSLRHDGYLLVPALLDGADLARITARLDDHVRQTVATWADNPAMDTTEACVATQFGLDDAGLGAPIPGAGAQGLHQDFGERGTGPAWQGLSAMWCISEFTRDNGPLRVIPGSHLASEPPIDTEHGYGTGMGPHPDEVKIIAPAGSLIVFNAPDLWHSGTFNYSPAPRLALTAGFGYGPPWRPPRRRSFD